MSDSGIYTIVTKATMLIRNDPTCGSRLMKCWLPADTWVGELQKTGQIDAALAIDTHNFNAAFAKSGSFGSLMSRFDGFNHTGVFHVMYQHQQYYYFTEEKRQISYPSTLNKAWKERVLETAANVFSIPSTGARPAVITILDSNTTEANNAAFNTSDQPSPKKRPRIEIVEAIEYLSFHSLHDHVDQ
jgi:hypothetical protein